MQVGDLVRHSIYGDIGVVTYLTEHRVIFICTDGRFFKTYRDRVETLCK